MAASALNIWAARAQARRRYQAAGYTVSASEHLETAVSAGDEGTVATHLIARKGEADHAETRIVEFAPIGCDRESDTRLATLRAFVAERPEWHLDIIEYAQPRDARPPAPSVVADWIAEARRLVPISGTGAVALARRSVASALFLLRVADGERYRVSPDLSDSLINGLEADSAVSAEEAETLRRFHAASAAGDAQQDTELPDEALTEAALKIAERCIAENPDVVDEMLAWFERHFCTPAQAGVAVDWATGDYVWLNAGPFDARAVLLHRFGDSERASLDRAVFLIERDGVQWARRDAEDLPSPSSAEASDLHSPPLNLAARQGEPDEAVGLWSVPGGLGLAERNHILQWANGLRARDELPALIRDLIVETTPTQDLIRIDCPTAEGIGRPDFDLEVETRLGTPWAPRGLSRWEVSTSADVTRNADSNYGRRTSEARLDASQVTYVHLTPRAWPESTKTPSGASGSAEPTGTGRQQAKRQWQAQRSEERHWREVRALDADDLLNWLIQAPATRARFSESLGLAPDGFTPARRRWDHEQAHTGGQFSADVLLAGREQQFQEFVEMCSTGGRTVYVVAGNTQDALDFISAAGARAGGLLDRMLVVSDAAAWRRLKREPGGGAILVAAEREVAEGAEPSRHCMVVPLSRAARPSSNSEEDEALIEIGLIEPTAAAKTLERQGLSRSEAWRLAALGRRSLGALRRTLQVGPNPVTPAWLDQVPRSRHLGAVWAALLAGRWSNRHAGDQSLLCEISGTDLSYEDLLLIIRPLSEGTDALIAQVGDQWDLVAPQEAWRLLASEMPESFLERFASVAEHALTGSETQRWPDGTPFEIDGRTQTQPVSSRDLRRGVARSLALLGTLGSDAPVASGISAETRAALIVRSLLVIDDDDHETGRVTQAGDDSLVEIDGAIHRTIQRIVDLGEVLPLLAEAAPDEFLEAFGDALAQARAAPEDLLALTEGSSGPSSDTGWYGLQHASEALAWSPEPSHLALVAESLLTLASVGNHDLAAKAHDCLVSLFWPRLPQTGLSTDRRNAVLVGLVSRVQIGEAAGSNELRSALWRVLWDLAPHRAGGSPNAAPEVREWPAIVEPAPQDDYASATHQVIALLLDMITYFASSATEAERLVDMFWPLDEGGRFMRLSPAARARALAIVEETAQRGDLDRSLLGDRLRSFIRLHHQFANAFWTLDPDELADVEQVAQGLGDDDPATTSAWLFEAHSPGLDVPAFGDDREEYERHLAELRRAAVMQAYAADGLEGIRRLAVRAHGDRQVSGVEHIGRLLAELAHSDKLTLGDGEGADVDALTPTLAAWLADEVPPTPLLDAPDQGASHAIGPESDAVLWDLVAMGFFAENLRIRHRADTDLSAWLTGLREQHFSATDLARLLTTLRDFPLAWEIAEALGRDVDSAYWKHYNPLPIGSDSVLAAEAADRLLAAGRADAAVEIIAFHRFATDDSDGTSESHDSARLELALRALEAVAGDVDSSRIAHPLRLRVEESLDWLSDQMPLDDVNLDDPRQVQLARLEIMLDDVPGSRGQGLLVHAWLERDPRFFVELIANMYAPTGESRPDGPIESVETDTATALADAAASKAWTVLHYWNRIPGLRDDGTVDSSIMLDWITQALELLAKRELLSLGSGYVGEMLAKVPAESSDEHGIVPPPDVRDVLEALRSSGIETRASDIEHGLARGISNLRGVHWRSLPDGGTAERELSNRYRVQAEIVGDRWPRTARVLRLVADSYDSHGRMHDIWSEQFARGS
ncbi:hypothetical protein [Candidatus Poriferisodalis sp.]|uniref:hypothetical protein n=1 Tax=Candidatus Poriferisodalis sp. TaxID=3101277 RepID=UPI003B01A5B5